MKYSPSHIDPRQLSNLLAVAQYGSFNRAAAARGLSQPALSGSIALLERRLGVTVLDRGRSGSTLNEFGRILVRRAQTVEAMLLQASEEVQLHKLGIDGPLRIGATPSLMLKFVPEITTQMLKESSNTAVRISEGLDDQLLSALRAGELDFTFGPISDESAEGDDITEEALFKDAYSIGVRPNHPLSRCRSLTLSQLRDAAWILPGPGNALRRHIEEIFASANMPWPLNCVTTTSLTMIESILERTDHVTLITSILRHAWRVRSIPLKGAGTRTIGIKYRQAARLSPLALRFRELAHNLAPRAP
jgi:DNA-binding transcriptional LysR family regulator